MINLHLSEEERQILSNLLEECISDLREEITRTENLDYKMMLKGRKAVLKKLLATLQPSTEPIIPDIG